MSRSARARWRRSARRALGAGERRARRVLDLELLLEGDQEGLEDGQRREEAGVLEPADELAPGPLLGAQLGDVDALVDDGAGVGGW